MPRKLITKKDKKPNPRFDMFETKVFNDDPDLPMTCEGKKCVVRIEDGDTGLIDLLNNKTLCKSCGQALRYHRKMAHIREENYKRINNLEDAE